MRKYEYVELSCEKYKADSACVAGHHEIIQEYAKKGYRYVGYLPVKIGPGGSPLSLELVFEKDD